MSADQPPAVDAVAREMAATVRAFVAQVMRDDLRMRMQDSEATTNAYARACMGNLPERLLAVIAAHDALAVALNAASPEAPPILSLTTEEPA